MRWKRLCEVSGNEDREHLRDESDREDDAERDLENEDPTPVHLLIIDRFVVSVNVFCALGGNAASLRLAVVGVDLFALDEDPFGALHDVQRVPAPDGDVGELARRKGADLVVYSHRFRRVDRYGT